MRLRVGTARLRSAPSPATRRALDRFVALFATERARFARRYPKLARTELRVLDEPCTAPSTCAPRDLAYATLPAPGRVTFLLRALSLPRANLVALLRHELAHLADPTPDEPGWEQRADDLAEQACGAKIRYDRVASRRDVQTLARSGRYPRPRHLHQ